MKKSVIIALGTAMLLSCACAKVVETPEISDGVYASVSDPVADNELGEVGSPEHLTKAISTDFKFTFSNGDKIKVFPVPQGDGVLSYEITPDAEKPSSAKFNSTSFKLNDQTYSTVYPSFSDEYASSLKFTGQIQKENNNTAHLAAYDYSWAKADIKNNAGTFDLAHKVCWIKITVNVPNGNSLQFSSIKLSADEGIANTATLDALTGEVTYIRESSDVIDLALASSDGDYIEVENMNSLVAYVTIPGGTYTNLYIRTFDNEGTEWRFKTHKKSELKPGKYYQATLLTEEPAEDTPFTGKTDFGIYSATTTDSPVSLRPYKEATDYLNYGTTEDSRIFRFFSVKDNEFCIIDVTPKKLMTGDDYIVTYDNGKTRSSGKYTIVKRESGKVWLENKTQQSGYIIPVE